MKYRIVTYLFYVCYFDVCLFFSAKNVTQKRIKKHNKILLAFYLICLAFKDETKQLQVEHHLVY